MKKIIFLFLVSWLFPLTAMSSSQQFTHSRTVIPIEEVILAGTLCESELLQTGTIRLASLNYVGSKVQPIDSMNRLQGNTALTNPENGKTVRFTIARNEIINSKILIDETGTGSLFSKTQTVGLDPEVGAGRGLLTVETIYENGEFIKAIVETSFTGNPANPVDCQELCDALDAGQCAI